MKKIILLILFCINSAALSEVVPGSDGVPANFPSGFTVAGGATVASVEAGTWVPVASNLTNVDSTANLAGQYLRVGNIIYFSIYLDIDKTVSATNTRVGLSLPVASNFTTTEDVIGNAVEHDTGESSPTGVVGMILADSGNDIFSLRFDSGDNLNRTWRITGSYIVK